jgi:NADPH:quinone reductase-like Zn-dependent oxidoreductase
MNAMVITGYGGPEVLDFRSWPTPEPAAGQVLIKVHACSVNVIDSKIRKGEAKMYVRTKPPKILGADLSGEIAQLGPAASRFKVGDKVYAKLPGDEGAYAEYVTLPEDIVALRPSNLSATEAAAVPAGATTALQALRDVAGLKAGQQVLINGASGGVGLFAVQIARQLGAVVTAVCGEAGAALVKELGAAEVIDYKKTDFTKLGKRWHVIFDVSATRSLGQCKSALEEGGVYVTTIAGMGDMIMPAFNFLRSKKGKVILVKPAASDLDYLRSLFEGGKLKVVVDKVFPLKDAAQAQQYAEKGRSRGKVVLDVAA